MSGFKSGSAYVDVAPSFRGWHTDVEKTVKGLGPIGEKAGRKLGDSLGDGIRQGLRDGFKDIPIPDGPAREKGRESGEQFAGSFDRVVRTNIKAALKALPKAEIDADSGPAERQIQQVRAELEALSNKTIGVDIDEKTALAEMRRLQQQLDMLGLTSTSVQVQVDTGAAASSLAAIQSEVNKLDRSEPTVEVDVDTAGAMTRLSALNLASRNTSFGIASMARTAAKTGAIAGLGIAALSATQGLVVLTAALAPLAGALAAVPVAIGGAILAFGALKVGLSGVGDALKNMDDPKKFAESLKELSPAARQTAVALRALKPAWDKVASGTQQSLFVGIAPALSRMARAVLPALHTSLVQAAAGWNVFGLAALKAVREQFVTSGLLEGLGRSMRGFFTNASGAIAPFLSAFSVLTGTLMSRVPGVGQSLTNLSKRFEKFILDANDAGKIDDWVNGAKNAFQQLGSVVGSVGRILGGIGKAMAAGSNGLSPLVMGLRSVADLVNGPAFQSGLTAFFRGISTGMAGLRTAMPAVGQMFAALGPVLGNLAAQLGPVLGQALSVVARAFAALLPSVTPLVSGLTTGLRPVLSALSPLLMQMAVALRPLGPALGQIAAALGGAFAMALRAVTPLLVVMAGALASTFTWLARNRPVLYGLVGAFAAYKAIMLATTIASAAYNVLLPFMTAGTMRYTIAQRLLNMSMLGFPLVWVVAALAAVGVGLAILWKRSTTFRAIVTGAWNGVKAAVGAVVSWFSSTVWPVLRNVFGWIGARAMWLYNNAIKPAFTFIRTVVGSVVNWFRSTVWPVLSAVLGWIGRRVGWLYKSVFKIYFAAIKAVTRAVVWWYRDVVWPIFRNVFGWIAGRAKWLYNSGIKPAFGWIRAIATSLYRFFRGTVWGSLKATFGFIAARAKWLYDHGIKPMFSAMKAAGRGLVKSYQWMRDKIGDAFSALKNLAKKPIEFVVNTVIGGMLGAVGRIPGLGGPMGKLKKAIGIPLRLADGGPVPGYAGGGTIRGPWRGPRADNVLGVSSKGVPTARVNPREYIHPVDAVKHYGTAAMDLVRQKKAAILPAHAAGGQVGVGSLPRFAKGGQTWPLIWNYVSKHFPGIRMTSNYRPGARSAAGPVSSHALGTAIDIGGSVGAIKKVMSHMAAKFGRNMRDLIYSPLWGGRMIYQGKWINAPAVTKAMHYNHGHIGLMPGRNLTGGAAAGMAGVGDAGGMLPSFSVSDWIGKKIKDVTSKFGKNPIAQAGAQVAKNSIGGLQSFVTGQISKFAKMIMPDGNLGEVMMAKVKGLGLDISRGGLIQKALGLLGLPTNSAALNSAVYHRVNKESSWNPNQTNNWDSNARAGRASRGLMQTIPSTFARYRLPSLSSNIFDPLSNLVAGLRYALTDPKYNKWGSGAKRLIKVMRKKGGYFKGGLVDALPGFATGGQAVQPKPLLFDKGGMLPTGVSVVENRTGRPEPLLRMNDRDGAAVMNQRPIEFHIHGVDTDNAHEVVRVMRTEFTRNGAFVGV